MSIAYISGVVSIRVFLIGFVSEVMQDCHHSEAFCLLILRAANDKLGANDIERSCVDDL
jgi:hypothetical protein